MTKRVRFLWSVAAVLLCVLASASLGTSRAYALAKGQSFKTGGNTYKITEYDTRDRDYEVTLVTYGSSNTKPTIDTVTYKGKVFEVERIGVGAFNTTRGHKVTSVKIGKHVDHIGPNAFRGCNRLATLNLRASDVVELEYKRGKWVVDDLDLGKNALAGAGSKTLKVLCGKSQKTYCAAYKKALASCGLRSSATVVK